MTSRSRPPADDSEDEQPDGRPLMRRPIAVAVVAYAASCLVLARGAERHALPGVVAVAWSVPGVVCFWRWLRRFLPLHEVAGQPWSERRRELASVFGFGHPAGAGGREWGLWLLAMFLGVPCGVWGLVVGPPRYDRTDAAVITAVSVAGGWIGLRVLDWRIARRVGGG